MRNSSHSAAARRHSLALLAVSAAASRAVAGWTSVGSIARMLASSLNCHPQCQATTRRASLVPDGSIGDIRGHGLVRNRAAGLRHVLALQNSTIPLSAGCFRAVADNRFFIPPVAWPCPVICWANIASHEFTRPQPAMTGVCPRAKAGHGPTMALPARFIKRGDGKSSMPAR